MKKLNVLYCLIVSFIVMQACNNASNDNKQDSVDSARTINDSTNYVDEKISEFVTEAASGGILEVQAGQMAQQKAQNQRVKDFGTMMIRDHSKGNDELKLIAAQKQIAIPSTLSDKHQKHLDELSKQSGKDFDKAYLDMMLNDHKGDIDSYTNAEENLRDSAIVGFARKTLPMLQMHLDSVKAIKDAIK